MLHFTETYLKSKNQTFGQNIFKPDKTKKQMKPNFTIKNLQADRTRDIQIQVLHFDENPVNCIYRSPVALPGSIPGTVNINVPVCGSNCPFFNLNKDEGKLYFGCTKTEISVLFEEIKPSIINLK